MPTSARKQQTWFEHSQRLPIMSSWFTGKYEILGNQEKDKFKQRKLKPSANFQVQQSIKICCQLSRKPRNNPRRNTAAKPFSSPYCFSGDLSYISTYTNSICFILPFLLDIHPPHHDINHCDIVTIVEHQQGFLTWLIAQVSYKISKCIRLFSHFFDALSAERMPIWKYGHIICQYKLINEEIPIIFHHYRLVVPNLPNIVTC